MEIRLTEKTEEEEIEDTTLGWTEWLSDIHGTAFTPFVAPTEFQDGFHNWENPKVTEHATWGLSNWELYISGTLPPPHALISET